jgi:hypothetical protein
MRLACVVGALLALTVAPVARGAQPVVRATATPAAPSFGDVVTYTVDVSVAPGQADVAIVATDVGVLTRVAAPTTVRAVEGGVGHVTVTERLVCLVARCVTGARGPVITIPAPRVRVGGIALRGTPTRLRIRPRVAPSAVRASEPAFRRPTGPPEVTSRVNPELVEALLLAGGSVLLVAGLAGLALPIIRRRARLAPEGRGDALRRAVELLRESTARGTPDRRRAASHAGRLVGEPVVAADAARVAWSRPDPGSPDVTALADRVERAAWGRE